MLLSFQEIAPFYQIVLEWNGRTEPIAVQAEMTAGYTNDAVDTDVRTARLGTTPAAAAVAEGVPTDALTLDAGALAVAEALGGERITAPVAT